MNLLLIFFSLFILPVQARLIEQELVPVVLKESRPISTTAGRTYNNYQGSRILASKKKNYPFLDQMEELLYPGKNFQAENPGKRLERIEIAVIGTKQQGSIPERVSRLESEVESWQLANAQALAIINSRTQPDTKNHAYNIPKQPAVINPTANQYQYQQPNYAYSTNVQANQRTRTIDYDYQNYRLASPLIQNIGRKAVNLMFSR